MNEEQKQRLHAEARELYSVTVELLAAWDEHENPEDGVAQDVREVINRIKGSSK